MKTATTRALALAACLAAGWAAPAGAQDSPLGKIDRGIVNLLGEDSLLIVGGGLGAITQPYAGADSVRYVPEPLIIAQKGKFEFIGRTFGYELYEHDEVTVKAIARGTLRRRRAAASRPARTRRRG